MSLWYFNLVDKASFSTWGGMLKMKIQAMCWVTSSKVAISNAKHKSSRVIGLPHPVMAPSPTPIYRDKCARGKKFGFLNSMSNHIMWPLIWKLMFTDFKNVTHFLVYTPWKLLQHLNVGWKTIFTKKIKT